MPQRACITMTDGARGVCSNTVAGPLRLHLSRRHPICEPFERTFSASRSIVGKLNAFAIPRRDKRWLRAPESGATWNNASPGEVRAGESGNSARGLGAWVSRGHYMKYTKKCKKRRRKKGGYVINL